MKTMMGILGASAILLSGCAMDESAQRSNEQVVVVRNQNDPYYGREFQAGARAVTTILRPESKLPASEFEERAQAIEGAGVLLDLISR